MVVRSRWIAAIALGLPLLAAMGPAGQATAVTLSVEGSDGAPGEDGESASAGIVATDLLNEVTAVGGAGGDATGSEEAGRGGDADASAQAGPTATFVDVVAGGGRSESVAGDATASVSASGRGGFHLDLDAVGGFGGARGGTGRIGDVSAIATFAGTEVEAAATGGSASDSSGRGGDAIIDGIFRAASPVSVYLALEARGGFGARGGDAVTRLDVGSGGGDIRVVSSTVSGRSTAEPGNAAAEIFVRGEGDGSVAIDATVESLSTPPPRSSGDETLLVSGVAEGAGDVEIIARSASLSALGESRGGGDVLVAGMGVDDDVVDDAVRGETSGNLALYQEADGSSILFHRGSSASLQVETSSRTSDETAPHQAVATAFNDGPGRATARAESIEVGGQRSAAVARAQAELDGVGSLRVDTESGVLGRVLVESSVTGTPQDVPIPLKTRLQGPLFRPPPPTVSGRGSLHGAGPLLADADIDLAIDDASDGTGSVLLEFVLDELADPRDLVLSLDRNRDSEGEGVEMIELALRVGGSSLVEESFSSLAELDAFFDGNELALGTMFPGEDLQLSLGWQSSASPWSFSGHVAIAALVPEPATGLLVLLALAFACGHGRRRS